MSERLPRLTELRDSLSRALEDDGSLHDHASPRLRALRQQMRDRRRRIVADLERLLATEGDRLFADRFVTVRHGRYVLPVKAEARARVRGIVHDRSQSGQTLFVEPEGAVDANNDLVQLQREEQTEVLRVLTDLTITYLVDQYYNAEDELGVAWDDPDIDADWQLTDPVVSERDRSNPRRGELPPGRTPYFGLRT